MPTTPHILLLGIDTPMTTLLWEAGAETSVICDRAAARRYTPWSEHRSVAITDRSDSARHLEIAAAIHRSRPVSRAVAMDDATMTIAAAINQTLAVPHVNSAATAEASVDKTIYRQRLIEAGLDGIQGVEATSAEQIIAFGDAVGWPVVVKPAFGSGSEGATVGVTREGAHAAWARAHRRVPDAPSGRVAVEQQARGTLLTVDTYSHHGDHRLLMVGFELVAPDRPVVVCTGAPAPISDTDWDQAVAMTYAALRALDVIDGPAHTELFLTEDGPVLIETQLRLGGDFPELTRAATGLDPYAVCVAGWTGDDPFAVIDAASLGAKAGTPSVMLWAGPNCVGDYLSRSGNPQADWVREIGRPPRRSRLVENLEDVPIGALCSARTTRRALARAQRALAEVRFRIAPDRLLPIPSEALS